MSGFSVATLKTDCISYEQGKRYMDSRLSFEGRPPGSIKEANISFLGGITNDGLGDLHLVRVNNKFAPQDIPYDQKPGTEESWSTYFLPNLYKSEGSWNNHLPDDIKIKLRTLLDFLFESGKYITDIKSSGGSFGSGNRYRATRKGPYFHAGVIPVENAVTIPNPHEFGIPLHTHSSDSSYDKNIFFSFVKNVFIVNDMSEDILSLLIECYTFLVDDTNHSYKESRELGEFLQLLHQGGFKYMIHRKYAGGVFVVQSLQNCIMKVGSHPVDNPSQKPITTGGGLHLPVCVVGRELFSTVTIQAIKEFGTHFEMYGMIKPGEIYILSRKEGDEVKHYWTFPAPHGAFIYRPLDGTDCSNLGCVILPFGVSKEEQVRTQATSDTIDLTKCIICKEYDAVATYGFNCNGFQHRIFCGDCASAYGDRLMVDGKYKCPICRKMHDSGPCEF